MPEPPPAEPEPKPEPQARIVLETPYKMGERAEPKTREAYAVDIRDRRHWNRGGTGQLLAELPGPEGHPDPRVRVNIDKVKGRHKAKTLQRVARKYHWINVVRCYRLGAYKDPYLRGWTHARATVTKGGKVVRPRMLRTELKDKKVAKCVVKKLKKLKFPPAKRGSDVWVDIKVSPGDEPMPPPDDLIVPGDGQLAIEHIQQVVEAALPELEGCYRAAWEYAPELWGRMLLRFHVNEHGTLAGVFEWGSRFPDARMQQCVLHAARKLKFSRPKNGEIRFFVPLRFSSEQADTARADE